MKIVHIRNDSPEAIRKAALILRKHLKKGDILLTGPIPKNIKTRFLNVVSMITRTVLRGITHACIYLGKGHVLEVDGKIIRSGHEVEKMTVESFVKSKTDNFGGVNIYVVAPKHYTRYYRDRVVQESINSYLNRSHEIKYSYWRSLVVGIRYVFFKNKSYKEDLSYKYAISCGEMVAHILKRSGIKIGKRASYTFVPSMYLFSKYFSVRKRIRLE